LETVDISTLYRFPARHSNTCAQHPKTSPYLLRAYSREYTDCVPQLRQGFIDLRIDLAIAGCGGERDHTLLFQLPEDPFLGRVDTLHPGTGYGNAD
jgi:hypothetical protein